MMELAVDTLVGWEVLGGHPTAPYVEPRFLEGIVEGPVVHGFWEQQVDVGVNEYVLSHGFSRHRAAITSSPDCLRNLVYALGRALGDPQWPY